MAPPKPCTNSRAEISESGAFVSAGDSLVDVASGQARNATPQDPGLAISTIDDDGARVAGIESVASAETGVQVFDVTGANGPRLFASLPQSAPVTDIALSHDGTRLAVTATYGGILWRVASDFVASEAIHPLNTVGIQFEANLSRAIVAALETSSARWRPSGIAWTDYF